MCGVVVDMDSFDFKKLYDVGEHLKDYSKEEEYQRSSISRYYYSAYHPTKDYYEKYFRKTLSSKDSHSALIKALENSPFHEENILGEKLRTLRNNRNHAEYRRKRIKKNKTKESKIKTDEIFKLIKFLINHPVRIAN